MPFAWCDLDAIYRFLSGLLRHARRYVSQRCWLIFLFASSCADAWAANTAAVATADTPRQSSNYCQDKRQFRIAYAACLDATLEQYQRELQTWVTKYELDLTEKAEKDGRDDALTMYRQSLALYQQYGLKHCRWQYQASLPDSQVAATRYKICLIKNTVQQIETLKQIQW